MVFKLGEQRLLDRITSYNVCYTKLLREFGHGWVQGAGHGVVSVRFETRGSGPGVMRTFAIDTAELTGADPVDSLDWPAPAEESAPA